MRSLGLVLLLGLASLTPRADAFCGFYVGGAGAKLFNNATLVVLMRQGARTVLAMQNNYQGPPANFAMVVPVPVVLQKENVKTLTPAVFEHVEQLAAPRLVEYWEQDPCYVERYRRDRVMKSGAPRDMMEMDDGGGDHHGVKIEAQFTVGEYEIVILSAKDSAGLDTWLRQEGYQIPDGAEPVLRPYVAAGMKFFVAKVDVAKVKMEGGKTMLSPLRFHYDSDSFNLPVRLGLLSSAGTQDLIVNILAPEQRYEVANFKNVTIPTNIEVANATRTSFGAFYASLFDATLERNRGAIVTEYAWSAGSCDPCPTPPLSSEELQVLGADVLPQQPTGNFVLTRLHARYTRNSLGEDLVFRAAGAIAGGREWQGPNGLEHGATPSDTNQFQARYIIRHRWTGPIACAHPIRNRWGAPPRGQPRPSPAAATGLAFAPRGEVKLRDVVRSPVPELGLGRRRK